MGNIKWMRTRICVRSTESVGFRSLEEALRKQIRNMDHGEVRRSRSSAETVGGKDTNEWYWIILNNFHRFQNFRQFSNLFSQNWLKSDRRHSLLEFGAKSGKKSSKIRRKIFFFFLFFPFFFLFFFFLRRILQFFLRIVDEVLSGFRDKFQTRVTCVFISIKFSKTN